MISIVNDFSFHEKDIIVIGCSTGPDSMALLDCLLKIKDTFSLTLIVAHVNHNIRKQSFEEQGRLYNESIESNKLAKAKEMGLQEVIDKMKAEYINVIRTRKHDMRPYVRELDSAELLMRHYLSKKDEMTDFKTVYDQDKKLVDQALASISYSFVEIVRTNRCF